MNALTACTHPNVIVIIYSVLMFDMSLHSIGERRRMVSSYLPTKKGEVTRNEEEGLHCNDACKTSGVVPGIQGKQKHIAYI